MATPFAIVGEIHNVVRQPSPQEDVAANEDGGPFVVGDAAAVAGWSGLELSARWKVRVLGQLAELPMLWGAVRPFEYHATREAALAHYQAVRENLMGRLECSFSDHPGVPRGASSEGRVELLHNGEGAAIAVLMLDRETDHDYAVNMTPGLGRLNVGLPDGPGVVSWNPPGHAMRVAVRSNRSGIDHVVMVFSPGPTEQRQFVANGLLGAARDTDLREVTVEVPSGLLVAQWARVTGRSTLGALGADPGAGLTSRLGDGVAVPLPVSDPDLTARAAGPMSWVIRVRPGTWRAQVRFTETGDGAGLSALVLSRVGAGSFQMLLGGGAGGRTEAGLTLERYAEVCVERDALIASTAMGPGGSVGNALMGAVGGGSVPALTALAARFGLPTDGNLGTLCRVTAWDQQIQGDPDLSAEYTAFYGLAHARKNGVQADPEALYAQAMVNQEAIANQAKTHRDAAALTREGHFTVFEAARTMSPDALLDHARTVAYAHLEPDDLAWALGRALAELCLHESDPIRVQNPRKVCPSFLAALWTATPPSEREGSLARFVKNETANVEEAYGINAPSLLDRL